MSGLRDEIARRHG